MKCFLAILGLALTLMAPGLAAPVTRDLGQGLLYQRVHQLPGDLPTDENERRHPCVLDLRYVGSDADSATALAAWLKFHATARAPVFVLANADTGSGIRTVLASRTPGTSIILVGAATNDFKPDIALKISPEAERRAYDAFEHGATADSLITENPDKPRNDEAKLAKDRQPEIAAGPGEDLAASSTDTVAPPKSPPPLMDAVLQRAVQLHRALLALKKL